MQPARTSACMMNQSLSLPCALTFSVRFSPLARCSSLRISQKPEIRKELQRASGEKRTEKVKAHGRDRLWFIIHALVLAGCIAAYVILSWKLIPLPQSALGLL